MPTRAQKKAQTAERIAAAARDLALEHGYDATTIDAITAAAGVSRATFFRYFSAKEAAFFADQHQHLRDFEAVLRSPRTAERPLQTVHRAFTAIAAAYMRDRALRLAIHRVTVATPALSAPDAQLDAQWEAAVARAFAEQLPGPKARAAAGMTIGLVRAVVRDWYHGGCARDLQAMGDDAFALLADGLS